MYYLDNRDRVKQYYLNNRDRIKEYETKNHDKVIARTKVFLNTRYRTDFKFRLICKTRNKIRQGLNRKTKSSSTLDILGIDIDSYRKWIEWQMTPDMTWDNLEVDHVKPICTFNILDDEDLKLAFNWKNTQPLLIKVHSQEGVQFNFLDYQIQIIKAYQFSKLNEEG